MVPEATIDFSGEPVNPEGQPTDGQIQQPEFAKSFKKEFVDANPDVFGDAKDLTDWASKMLMKQRALLPPPVDATEEDLAAYRKAQGLPEDASGYQFEETPGITEEDQTRIRDLAFKFRLDADTANAVHGLIKADREAFAEALKAEMDQQKKDAEAALKEDYGEKYTEKLEQAHALIKRIGGDEIFNFLDESSLGNNKDFIKMMISFSDMVSEDTLNQREKGGGKEETPDPYTERLIKFEDMEVSGN